MACFEKNRKTTPWRGRYTKNKKSISKFFDTQEEAEEWERINREIIQDLGWCVDDDVDLDNAFSIVTTPSPSASPTPRPTVAPTAAQTAAQTVAQTAAPTATRGSDTVDAAHRLSGVSAALLVLALAA